MSKVEKDLLPGLKALGALSEMLRRALIVEEVEFVLYSDRKIDGRYFGYGFTDQTRHFAVGIFFDEPSALWFEVKPPSDNVKRISWQPMADGWYGTSLPLTPSFFDSPEGQQQATVRKFVQTSRLQV